MTNEDLFSKALEEPAGNLDLTLPKDDVEVGIISSDEEVVTKEVGGSVSSSSSPSSSDNEDEDEDDEDKKTIQEGTVEDEDEDEEDPSSVGAIRSKHEVAEEPIPEIPDDYHIDPNTNISEIGVIKSAFENNIVIHAVTSGERRVLKEGSILCLEDRTLIGSLCEVFGKLQDPFYRISLPSSRQEKFDELKGRIGEKAYIVVPDAHWVDTFELRKLKGTDASNGYDEELSEGEQEFSDDEKEAMYKKMKKEQKKRKDGSNKMAVEKKEESGNPKKQKQQRNQQQFPSMRAPAGMTHGYRSRNSRQGNTNSRENHNTSYEQAQPSHLPPMPYQQQMPFMQQTGYYIPNQQSSPPQAAINPQQQQQPLYDYNLSYAQHLQQQQPYPQNPQQQQTYPQHPQQQQQQMQQPPFFQNIQQTYPNSAYYQPPQQQFSYPVSQYAQPGQQANMQQVLQLHQLLLQQQTSQQKKNPPREFDYDD